MNTERKHTPAPWHFTSTDHYENPNGYQNVTMYDSNDNSIIESCSCCEGINAENKADIVLIAAAPDMLDALEALLKCVLEPTDAIALTVALCRANRAIAKAKGESHV